MLKLVSGETASPALWAAILTLHGTDSALPAGKVGVGEVGSPGVSFHKDTTSCPT